MSDAVPNYGVEAQKLRATIAGLKANIERQKLEIMEMDDRRRRNEENISATEKTLGELEKNLAGLVETHGLDRHSSSRRT